MKFSCESSYIRTRCVLAPGYIYIYIYIYIYMFGSDVSCVLTTANNPNI